MKIGVLFMISFLILNGCKRDKQPSVEGIKKNADSIIENWHKSASQADFESYFDAMGEESIFIGTDASENWSKNEFMEFSRPFFDKGKAWSFIPLERNIYVSENKNVVWFDELLDTWMGTCRGSGILTKEKDSWKIKHYVLSVCIPNEDMNKVIDLKAKNDSIFRKQLQAE